MTSIAVIAHQKKTFGGGLPELRQLLADRGFSDPLWYDVPKSKKAPKLATKAVEKGADLLLVWGGDGMQQRCIDAVAGTGVTLGILPAGTANLLANNLGVPIDLAESLEVALHGARRSIDVGVLNGERFAVMAGVGFDAVMMDDADGGLKDRFGRLAYVWTGARATKMKARKMRIDVDGERWFKGKASCLLIGNLGTLSGGLHAFPDAKPDDGLLEIGVVTAKGAMQWARVLSRLATGHAERSPLAHMGRGRAIDVKLEKPMRFELDGGARTKTKRIQVSVEPGAVTVCVPEGRDYS
jgi:diacylglycerol kinase (ATP)